MFCRVNLLLLLSALLSALTGVQAGARAPQATVAVTQATQVAASARAVRATVAGRPVVTVPTLLANAIAPLLPSWNLVAVEPLFLSRRRE